MVFKIQVARTRFVLIVGRIDNERPVHASRAFLCVTIQSTAPVSCTTAKEVTGDRTEIRAVTGLVDETWLGVNNKVSRMGTSGQDS